MKYTFATTSVAALLLAMPALAQAPAANAADPATPANNAPGATAQASGGAATGTGPEITVKQPPPVITVQPHAPNVTVTPGKPDVAVQQAPPKVDVATPKPNVVVDTGKPQVNVLPGGKPDVAVQGPAGNAPAGNANGMTAPAGTAANQSNDNKQPNDNTTVGSGSTTPPGSGAAAVAPTSGVFPMATDAKNLIGKNVYGADGNQVGEVNNLLVGADGKVHAAVIEFGGFLGIGERKVAVPWDQLNVTQDRVTTNMTADQIKAAPQWDKNKPGQFAEDQPLNK